MLFDYGGTLVTFRRPSESIASAYERIAARLAELGGPAVPAATLVEEVHDRVDAAVAAHQRSGRLDEIDVVAEALAAYRTLGVELTAGQLDELLRLEQEAWWDGVVVDRRAPRLLGALRGAGIRLGLCSNAPYRAASLHDQLRHFGLDSFFDSVTFSAEVGWRKPSPRIFAAALRALEATPETTVMVGDSVGDDIAGAAAAGMRTILLQREGNASCEQADRCVRNLAEVADLLLDSPPIIAAEEGR